MTEQIVTSTNLAEQIKERVRRADQERITKRADAAAAVAAKLHERDRLAQQLAEADRELAALVTDATNDLMTAQELAEFIGVKRTDFPIKQTKKAPRKRRVTTT